MSILSLNDSPKPDDRLSPEPVTTPPCVQCGAFVPKASKFCPECGASQSPQQNAAITSDSSKPFAQPNNTEAEPDSGRLPPPGYAEQEERPIFAWASSSTSEDSEPKQSSGLLKLVLICGALVLAIVVAGALLLGQRDTGIAHFKRGEELKNAGDYTGAKQELEVCLSECKGREKNTAREELGRIEPLIAAQAAPPAASEQGADDEARKRLMQPQLDWVAANLVNYNFRSEWNEPDGYGFLDRYVEDTSADGEIESPCLLTLSTMENYSHLSSSKFKNSGSEKDCRVNLAGLPSDSVKVVNDQSMWIKPGTIHYWEVQIEDSNAVVCTVTDDGEKQRNTVDEFAIDFPSKQKAEKFRDGFEKMVQNSCASQRP